MTRIIPRLNTRVDCKDSYSNYWLRNARVSREYTLGKLAIAVGVSPNTIFSYERLRSFPSSSRAKKVALVLGMNVDQLFPPEIKGITEQVKKMRRREKYKKLIGENLGRGVNEVEAGSSYSEEGAAKIYERPFDYAVYREHATELSDMLAEALGTLTPREREIVEMRYGLSHPNPDGLSLAKVGEVYGLTRERVRQIESHAFRKMQKTMANQFKNYFDEK